MDKGAGCIPKQKKTYVEKISEKGRLYFKKEFMDQMYKTWSEERKIGAIQSFLLTNDFG